MTSSPVEFCNRSVPPAGKSSFSVLLTWTFCRASSSPSSRQATHRPNTASLFRIPLSRFIEFHFGLGEYVVPSGHPDIQSREQENAHDQVGEQTAHNHDCERAL